MKKETAFQQILNNSDFHMDTFGAIQALAACALERDPKSAMDQLPLESVIKDSHFYAEFLEIINSDYDVPQAPKEYARFEEMKDWLYWLEQVALATGLLFFIDKENTKSQNEILAFLKKQESHLKNRQDLWLYRNQAEKAEKMVFPWTTILSESQEIPHFENCKNDSEVAAIADHLFLKELTPHQEIALIGFFLYADKKHPLVCHYKEVCELGMTIWMLPEDEETKKLRSKASLVLCSVVKGDAVFNVSEEAFEKIAIPHIGEIKFFEETTRDLETLVQVVFADGRIVTLRKQEDSEEDVFARYTWQDPILGETQIVIKSKECLDIFYVLRDQKEKLLKAMESEISIHTLLILETASLLEHSSIMENCEAVKQLLFCEEEQKIEETLLELPLLVLETRILLERLVEKNKQLGILWQGVSDEIFMQDIALANLDQFYEEKEFDQVFLLFDEEESLLPYVEGLNNSESFAWWVMPLLLMSKSEEEVEEDFLQILAERIK